MNTSSIRHALQTHSLTKQIFTDVVPCDKLPTHSGTGLYVVNTHPHDMPGQHWVVVDYTPSHVMYMDSYGLPPTPAIHTALCGGSRPIHYTPRRLQGQSDTCGLYCLYYALTLVSGGVHSMTIFSDALHANDLIVTMHAFREFDL